MKRDIKMVDIKAQYDEIKEDLFKSWEQIFEKMHLMLGPNMKAFEEEFAEYSQAKFGVGVDSGTAAVLLGLKALGIGPGHDVITVSFTFFATVEAIILAGARPVMVDVDESSYTMSVNEIKQFITDNCVFDGKSLKNKISGNTVRAIVPVHIYGMPADMDEIIAIADKYNLEILEDCAQAHGALYKGKRVGSFGHAAAYSFYFSKNLSALGEGGIVLTSSEAVRDALAKLRLHGQSDKYTHSGIGYNSRLDEIQATVLRLKLKKLDQWNQKRIQLSLLYDKMLNELPVKTPPRKDDREPVYHLYVIRTRERERLTEFLREKGIGVGVHYPIPCHLQPGVDFLGYCKGDLPVTENLCNEVISLPMHPHLKEEEVEYICHCIQEFFK